MSTIIATTLSDGSVSVPTATVVNGSAKAWVQHLDDATVNTSFGTSSVVDAGTGINTVNFTTAFSTANFITAGVCQTGADRSTTAAAPTVSSTEIETFNQAGANVGSTVNSVFHGDLA